jgi:hypothetical protein
MVNEKNWDIMITLIVIIITIVRGVKGYDDDEVGPTFLFALILDAIGMTITCLIFPNISLCSC